MSSAAVAYPFDVSVMAQRTGTRPMILIMALLRARFGYATQMSGTASFWNTCGEATAEDG